MKVLENNAKIAEIQSRISKYGYLSKNALPGYADGRVFQILQSIRRYPDRSINPNFYHWYILMKQFSLSTTSKWIADQLYFDSEDTLIIQFVKLYGGNKKDTADTLSQNEVKYIKSDNPNQFQYTVDIYMNWMQEKIKLLQKILEDYQAEIIDFDEKDKSKFIRVIYIMDASKSEEMVNKISDCINYANIQIKKRSMRANLLQSLEKNVNQT